MLLMTDIYMINDADLFVSVPANGAYTNSRVLCSVALRLRLAELICQTLNPSLFRAILDHAYCLQ